MMVMLGDVLWYDGRWKGSLQHRPGEIDVCASEQPSETLLKA